MKAILRTAIAAASVASAVVMSSTPAAAATAVVFTGTASLSCFGCGTVTDGNNATLSVSGVFQNTPVAAAAGSANDFTIDEPPGDPNCIISGTANGLVTVAGQTTTFDWTRLGAVAVVSTGFGTGAAVFAVTSPLGASPCGGPVTAQFAGALAGA